MNSPIDVSRFVPYETDLVLMLSEELRSRMQSAVAPGDLEATIASIQHLADVIDTASEVNIECLSAFAEDEQEGGKDSENYWLFLADAFWFGYMHGRRQVEATDVERWAVSSQDVVEPFMASLTYVRDEPEWSPADEECIVPVVAIMAEERGIELVDTSDEEFFEPSVDLIWPFHAGRTLALLEVDNYASGLTWMPEAATEA